MSERYMGKFVVEVDGTHDKVHDLFKRSSVKITYWHSIVPPNKVEYEIGPLSEEGFNSWLKAFDSTGCKYRVFKADYDKVKDSD